MTKRNILISLAILSFIAGILYMSEYLNLSEEGAGFSYVQVLTKEAKRLHQKGISDENSSLNKNTSTENTSTAQQEESRYGRVIHGTDHVIIYNSLPKCGSRTFGSASRMLWKHRSIHMAKISLRKHDNRYSNEREILEFVESVEAPAFCQGHGYFATSDHIQSPVHINFMRDPVSRMVSAFYYTRFGDNNKKRRAHPGHTTKKIMSIDECISSVGSRCIKTGIYPITFCGFSKRCQEDRAWALEQAKLNINKYYTYIGITEDYEASLRIFEHLLPDVYTGMTELYLSLLNQTNSQMARSKTRHKEPLTQDLHDVATKRFAVDYELYNYIYDRHRELKARYGIN
ncbi:uronyl 2-sulfotransferase-like isoform X1 [Lytechinus variegatus]|uniref:uronyl 2-sulfotransferase-like isoform X1 n=1 Tax=Lytechinus variegatus TaxID=7654 RepID=UPI001BB14D38|nr:uronyl 2-sulfotransferase-like isoform X1 [Lytechinus variegatus]